MPTSRPTAETGGRRSDFKRPRPPARLGSRQSTDASLPFPLAVPLPLPHTPEIVPVLASAPFRAKFLVSDEQLAALVARRDESAAHRASAEQAYGELYARHGRRLLAFLATRTPRSDLDDVGQEIWQRVWQNLPRQFHGGNFRAWLHQIARNYLIDRSRRRRTDELSEDVQYADPKSPQPDDVLLDTERTTILEDCLQRLGDKLEAVVRARLTGDEYDDICTRLAINPNQIYKLFHQAKSQLTTCVERALP